MRRWSWIGVLALAMGLGSGARPASAQTVQDSVNADKAPAGASQWGLPEVGWFYTPTTSYTLKGIDSRFGSGEVPSQNVTLEVRSAGGDTIGGVLRSQSFTVVNTYGIFQGATFSDLPLVAGTQYFIGFRNLLNVGVNFTSAAGAVSLGPLRYGLTDSGSYASGQISTAPSQAILRFHGDPTGDAAAVPEPGALALFLPALGVMALLWRRRSA